MVAAGCRLASPTLVTHRDHRQWAAHRRGTRCGARYVNSRVLLRCLYIYEGGCFVSARYTESILDRGELLTYIGCCVRVFTVCMYLLIIIYVVYASRRQKLEIQSNCSIELIICVLISEV